MSEPTTGKKNVEKKNLGGLEEPPGMGNGEHNRTRDRVEQGTLRGEPMM